jgi:LacI family transcriptional regulator
LARSLRAQRTRTLGVLVPELSDGYSAMVLSGVEDYLLQAGYFYILASHRHLDKLIEHYPKMFADRCVEGIIAVDTPYRSQIDLPVITVSGHEDTPGITNIVLNHQRAASLGLDHLIILGHKQIAFIKGQDFSSDTEVRWQAICEAADFHRLKIDLDLVAQLEGDKPSPELGYIATQKLLASRKSFTALFAFNDISAIGAIRALSEAGLRVPEDISVLGFDDVYAAAFHNPALTTIRQPLFEMGKLAAKTLLQRIADAKDEPFPEILTVEPELVVRQSTAPAKKETSLR